MNNDKTESVVEEKAEIGPKPDETGGFYFSTFIKITDPDTNEVLLQARGDN
jgi:hypothetical protein